MSQNEEISFNFNNLTKMRNLRFLKFCMTNKCKIFDFEDSGYIFPKLRYLYWDGYLLKSLPIDGENLISLALYSSMVEQLWDGVENIVNLKKIELVACEQLTKLPDLSKAQNLEILTLQDCSNLVKTHSSVQYLKNLAELWLIDCYKLKSLPRRIRSESLAGLSVWGCSNLKRLPKISSYNLKWLYLSELPLIEELPSSIGCQSRLSVLELNCLGINSLPSNFCKLKSLEHLRLSNCSKLQILPDELEALEHLYVEGTRIGRESFSGREEMGSFMLPILLSLYSLRHMDLTNCRIRELPESLGQLLSLEVLILNANYFERIPESIINLSKLEELQLKYCNRLQALPNLPRSLQYLDASHCSSLKVSSCLSIFKLTSLYKYVVESFHLSNCYKLDGQLSWSGDYIFPGSEIPKWFKYRSMGPSVILKLPSADWNEFKNKFVGYAFCFIVNDERCYNCNNHDLFWSVGMQVKTEAKTMIFPQWNSCFGPNFVTSGCVVLGLQLYSLSEKSDEFRYITDLSVQFSVNVSVDHLGGCCELVKKCGISLLYAQDLEEEERHLHPKRLKCSTN